MLSMLYTGDALLMWFSRVWLRCTSLFGLLILSWLYWLRLFIPDILLRCEASITSLVTSQLLWAMLWCFGTLGCWKEACISPKMLLWLICLPFNTESFCHIIICLCCSQNTVVSYLSKVWTMLPCYRANFCKSSWCWLIFARKQYVCIWLAVVPCLSIPLEF